jgi:hypothetical protein
MIFYISAYISKELLHILTNLVQGNEEVKMTH